MSVEVVVNIVSSATPPPYGGVCVAKHTYTAGDSPSPPSYRKQRGRRRSVLFAQGREELGGACKVPALVHARMQHHLHRRLERFRGLHRRLVEVLVAEKQLAENLLLAVARVAWGVRGRGGVVASMLLWRCAQTSARAAACTRSYHLARDYGEGVGGADARALLLALLAQAVRLRCAVFHACEHVARPRHARCGAITQAAHARQRLGLEHRSTGGSPPPQPPHPHL